MHTHETRSAGRFHFGTTEQVPVEVMDALAALQPGLHRLRRREWRVMVIGPSSSRERDAAAIFSARLHDLADAVSGR